MAPPLIMYCKLSYQICTLFGHALKWVMILLKLCLYAGKLLIVNAL